MNKRFLLVLVLVLSLFVSSFAVAGTNVDDGTGWVMSTCKGHDGYVLRYNSTPDLVACSNFLNGFVIGGGSTIDNSVIGATTPAAGTFTTATATTANVTTGNITTANVTSLKTLTRVGTAPTPGTNVEVNSAMTANITSWTGASWAWDAGNAGQALHTAGATTALTQAVTVVVGQTYKVCYTLFNTGAETITVSVGGVGDTARSVANTYCYYPTASATTAITITPTTNFAGSVKNVTVQPFGPALTSCGTSAVLSPGSSDAMGMVAMGTGSPTACTVTFQNNALYANTPAIRITPTFSSGTFAPYISAKSATAFTVTFQVGNATSGFTYDVTALNE